MNLFIVGHCIIKILSCFLFIPGLPFKDLYSKSREQFLVSSDLALRAQLTEFLDHKLVRMKRTYDGSENLVIPIENTLLQQFLEQQKSWYKIVIYFGLPRIFAARKLFEVLYVSHKIKRIFLCLSFILQSQR